jgi:hypothetical protein
MEVDCQARTTPRTSSASWCTARARRSAPTWGAMVSYDVRNDRLSLANLPPRPERPACISFSASALSPLPKQRPSYLRTEGLPPSLPPSHSRSFPLVKGVAARGWCVPSRRNHAKGVASPEPCTFSPGDGA